MKQTTATDNKETKVKTLSPNLFPVVGIGASAGGLDAFKKLIKAIPENSGMAYVLVQHLDPNHESMLPELLQKVTKIPVLEISDDIKVLPDHIYILPSNKMMVANDGVLQLTPRIIKKNERNLPIDLFFTSLADVHQAHAIGVVLSGTGSDGTKGLKAIKDNGGITFAQDEASAAYDGMPNSAVQADVVDFILSPELMPQKLLEIIPAIGKSDDALQNLPQQDEEVFHQILVLLRLRKGTDFTYYKQTTIRRRILRRMALNKNEEPAAYLKFLRENKPEQDILYLDLLIPVTSFFRDHKVFDNLCESVYPHILKNKNAADLIRIWVAACSTGQEAYSIAICLKEFLGDSSLSSGEGRGEANNQRVQIFATDLNTEAILKARTGIYTKNELDGITPKRLQENFTKTDGGYQVNKNVREMCVFAAHNFLKDPPFGKVDFISCRNVLIYMEPYLQKKALTTFHYALNPKGFLLLGKSETSTSVPDLFAVSGKQDKLFTRKDVPGRFMLTTSQRSEQNMQSVHDNAKNEGIRTDFQKTADDIMLSKYTPAGVVVNEAMDIVHYRGKTGKYLEQMPGKPSQNLMQLAKNGLAFELRNILHKVKKEKKTIIKDNIPFGENGSQRNISIEALLLPDTIEPHYLILFHDNVNRESSIVNSDSSKRKGRKAGKPNSLFTIDHSRIQQLEQEIAQSREDMRSITEDQEAVNEELQSANEELMSGSEELQSLNEELETSKEELQSTNEELTVVNQEMIGLNDQVTEARDYSENIIANIREPLLVLDKNLRVKTANNSFYKTFLVNELETEGVLIYDIGNGQWNIPELRTLLEKIIPQKSKFNDLEVTHTFSSIGERVMLLNAREVLHKNNTEKLILLSIEDITERKQAEKKIKDSEKQLHNIFSAAPAAIAVLEGPALKYVLANADYQKMTNRTEAQLLGKTMLEAFPELTGTGAFEIFENVFKTGEAFSVAEYPVALNINNDGVLQQVYYKFIAEPIKDADGKFNSIMVLSIDVTEQIEARKKIEDSDKRYNMMLMNSPFTFAVLKGEDLIIALANDRVKKVWGKGNDIEGKSLLEIMPELKDTPFPALLAEVRATGIPFHGVEVPSPPNLHGQSKEEYFNFVFQPYLETDQTISGITIIGNDVTEQVIAKRKIIESEHKYNMILMHSPFAFSIMKGKDMVITLANDSMKEFWGKGSNVEGKTLLQVLPELKDQPFPAMIDKVYTTGIPIYANEILARLKHNGKMEDRYFNIVYQPHREADETISGVTTIAHEVTSQVAVKKAVEDSEMRYNMMVMQSPFAFAVLKGKDMVITLANDSVKEMWGKGKEVEGKPLLEVLPEIKDQGFPKLLDEVYNTGIAYTAYEVLTHLKHNGKMEEVYFNFVYQPYREADQTISGVVIIANEVTTEAIAKKQILQLQQKHGLELEEKVQLRTLELRKANEELENMNEELSSFTYVSSHDLQEPLRKIQTFTGRIFEADNDNLSEKSKDYFERIQGAAKRMQQLIADLLTFSRVNTGERKFDTIHLNSIVKKVVTDLKEDIHEKHAIIEATELCDAKIIEFQFHQLMDNLICNALKFSKPDVPPHIIIKSCIEKGSKSTNAHLSPEKNYCHITVTDNGIGFEPEYKTKIFEVFQKLHGKTEYPGTGIGLAIVKKIVDNHEGIITATSELGKGARFDIYIPAD